MSYEVTSWAQAVWAPSVGEEVSRPKARGGSTEWGWKTACRTLPSHTGRLLDRFSAAGEREQFVIARFGA